MAPPAADAPPQTGAVAPHLNPALQQPVEAPQAAQHTPVPPAPPQAPVDQTEQFPLVSQQPQPMTEQHPQAVPSPPVTEQMPPRTPPASRQPFPEPTPPVTGGDDDQDPDAERLLEAVRSVHGVRDAYYATGPDGAPNLRLMLEDGVDRDEVHQVVSAVVAERRAADTGRPNAPEPSRQSAAEPAEEPQAELAQPAVEAVMPAAGAIELRRVEIDSSDRNAEVTVTLAVGEESATGTAGAVPIDWHVERAAASATVEALRPFLDADDARIQVEDASIVSTGPVHTAVVVVLWLDDRSSRRIAGAAVVAGERTKAVVSATLGALAAEVAH